MLRESIAIKLMAYEMLKSVDRSVAISVARMTASVFASGSELTANDIDCLAVQYGIWRTHKAALLDTTIWSDILRTFLAWFPNGLRDYPKRDNELNLAWVKRLFQEFNRNAQVFQDHTRYLLFTPEETSMIPNLVPNQTKIELRSYTNVSLNDYAPLSRVMRIMGVWMDQIKQLPAGAVLDSACMPSYQSIPATNEGSFLEKLLPFFEKLLLYF